MGLPKAYPENPCTSVLGSVKPETWQPDKTTILEHFKNTGELIPGIEIITDKKSINIR